MTNPSLITHIEELEELLDEISDAVHDPALSDDEAREEVRGLLAGEGAQDAEDENGDE